MRTMFLLGVLMPMVLAMSHIDWILQLHHQEPFDTHPVPQAEAMALATLKVSTERSEILDMTLPKNSSGLTTIVHYTGDSRSYISATVSTRTFYAPYSGRFHFWQSDGRLESLAWVASISQTPSGEPIESSSSDSAPKVYLEKHERQGRPPPVRHGSGGGLLGMIQGLMNPIPSAQKQETDKEEEPQERTFIQKWVDLLDVRD